MTGLRPEQKAILDFIALADGEGSTLAHDIAMEIDVPPRSMGFRLRRLEELGLVQRVVVRERPSWRSDQLHGWVLTDAGRDVVYDRQAALWGQPPSTGSGDPA